MSQTTTPIQLPGMMDLLPRGDGSYVLKPRVDPQGAGAWVSVREAARVMGVHRQTVYRLLDAGQLEARRISAHTTMISLASISKHIERQSDRENW
jgi:excisionase family DNA binding protein